MKLKQLLIMLVIGKFGFLNFANKEIICRVPRYIGFRAMQRQQTLLPSLLWIFLVSKLVYQTLILNAILTKMLFPLVKMIGMVWSQTSFILSSKYLDISSPTTGSEERMKLSCVLPASVIYIASIHTS